MTFFADLTPHTYVRTKQSALNVGWLDASTPFPIGDTPAPFRIRLKQLCQQPIYLHRGFHECHFCSGIAPTRAPAETRGNGQIRVQDASGTCYAAPALVWHYVEAHRYNPPAQFIEAVLTGTVVGEE